MARAAAAVLALTVVAACSTTTNYYASPNDALLAVGEQPPEGYPRSYITREKAGCIETTESWRKEPKLLKDQTAWLKQVERKTVDCR